jgi:hypothetical protein
MAKSNDTASGRRFKGWRVWLGFAAAVPVAFVAACMFLTAPLEPAGGVTGSGESQPIEAIGGSPGAGAGAIASVATGVVSSPNAMTWPANELSGLEATRMLYEVLEQVEHRLSNLPGYTATLVRQERVGGKLGPEQHIKLKIRHRPFGIYLRFIQPDAGKEAVYAEGRYDNHVIAHAGGVGRFLVPRLKVPPTSAVALAGNRHPVTDAGLLALTRRLVSFRKLDLEDPDAETILDTYEDESGRTWWRSIHKHTIRNSARPFAYVEVNYDPETGFPLRIESYEWPEPGDPGPRRLAERYFYEDLNTEAVLSDIDFDPANPTYEFRRL